MTGEELYERYGKPLLGPWEDQPVEVKAAWGDIAAGVSLELERAKCTTEDCDGDARYAAPGRQHRPGCEYPLDEIPPNKRQQNTTGLPHPGRLF